MDEGRTEFASQGVLDEMERLRADIAQAGEQFDRHHLSLPGTWPWERAKLVVDDAERLRDVLRRLVTLCAVEESEDGFPFNFELRQALADARETRDGRPREGATVRTPSSGRKHAVRLDVEDFHRALGIAIGDSPAIRRPELRAALIEEEATETIEAIRRGDLVEAIDGLCDLLAVTYGAAIEFGIDLAPFWAEVHRTNMAKAGGPVREDGKRLKPPGWTPPDIAGVLALASGENQPEKEERP